MKKHDGTYASPSTCGTLAQLSSIYCDVTLAELTDTFGLVQGERVVAKSKARNELGWGDFSDLSTS